jgi:hypothetical protein
MRQVKKADRRNERSVEKEEKVEKEKKEERIDDVEYRRLPNFSRTNTNELVRDV